MIFVGRKRLYATNAARQRNYRKNKKPYRAKRRQAHEELENRTTQAIKAAQGLYDVLVIDPPWPVTFQGRDVRPNQVALAYPTMTVDAIRALPLPLAESAHVWLWTTHRFLPEAFACLDAWGLRYCCAFVWIKPGGMQPLGLPQFTTDFALYARKGSAVLLDTTHLPTHVEAPRGAHSAKPDAFYRLVARVTAGRRLDMFARHQIPGFDAWGLEAPFAQKCPKIQRFAPDQGLVGEDG
jgi:N6-adenosine-specific RNA methylase IME4